MVQESERRKRSGKASSDGEATMVYFLYRFALFYSNLIPVYLNYLFGLSK